jgi:type I restriction enzyme S subunit
MYLEVTEQKLSALGSSLSVKLIPGSLILSIAGSVGKSCISKIKCCIHDGFVYFPRFRGDSRFLYYLFTSGESFRGLGKLGTQLNLNTDTVGSIVLGIPPLEEQAVLSDFLDEETGKLDLLITKKRELVERLKEKRSALISRTVTRGLPPEAARAAGLPENPPLKPSGFDWIGEIPLHWGVVTLRYAFHNLDYRRIPVAAEDRAALKKTYPYYGASGIIDFVDEFIFDETLILVAEDGANLLSRSTPLAFLAKGKYWVNNHAHILKPIKGDIRYWAAVLQTYDFSPLVTGAAQPKLTSDNLGGIRLPNPPPDEQFAIANYLDCETEKIDVLVVQVESAIERLQEYRAALINAAVTGKIDVRKAIA